MGKKVEDRTWFTARQEKFLELVSGEKYLSDKFYLTGGTALSACYYNHRESLDLDFFSPVDFSIDTIGNIIAINKKKLGFVGIKRDVNSSANIYILNWGDEHELKLDFNFFAFKRLETGKITHGVSVDSLVDIAVNKLDAMVSRREIRDYIDLYKILKQENLSVSNLLKLHKKKTGFELLPVGVVKIFLKVNEAQNMPVMKIDFDKNEMIEFFENEAKKLKGKILF